jgi:5-methylcytosine-specific restriction endonuclease McrA
MGQNILGLKYDPITGKLLGREKRIPKKILRRIVWERDKGRCQLCGAKIRAGEDWDLARKRAGGPYTVGNTFVAHHTCNISQGKKTPSEIKRALGIAKRTKQRRKKKREYNMFELPKIDLGI